MQKRLGEPKFYIFCYYLRMLCCCFMNLNIDSVKRCIRIYVNYFPIVWPLSPKPYGLKFVAVYSHFYVVVIEKIKIILAH